MRVAGRDRSPGQCGRLPKAFDEPTRQAPGHSHRGPSFQTAKNAARSSGVFPTTEAILHPRCGSRLVWPRRQSRSTRGSARTWRRTQASATWVGVPRAVPPPAPRGTTGPSGPGDRRPAQCTNRRPRPGRVAAGKEARRLGRPCQHGELPCAIPRQCLGVTATNTQPGKGVPVLPGVETAGLRRAVG
jgi:hypothetical protein